MANLNDWLKEEVIEKLEELKGEGYSCYPSDLSFRLFETANVDGSYTYSRHDAMDWIKEYFDDLGEVYEEIQEELGEVKNPFENPEVFQVQVILFKAGDILYESETFSNLEDETEFTDRLLDTIIAELKKA